MDDRKYYAAYDERYKTAHAQGVSWSSDISTPIVMEVIEKYHITHDHRLLEIGCGEGRDSRAVLEHGYDLMATDISPEAIAYCQKQMSRYTHHFKVLDCLSDKLDAQFDFIYGIAVIHMLVLDEDRDAFYQFIYNHLKPNGLALICSMGDGEFEMQSDISKAFDMPLYIWNIKSTTKAQEGLYVYDTIQRLYDGQFGEEGVDDIAIMKLNESDVNCSSMAERV